MASGKVYIHELIDIIGHNRNRYMHHMTANWCPIAREERNQLCFGVWATVGSTGSWPQVVNMWELDGWDGLVGNFEVEFAGGRDQDPSLAQWWAAAADLRRGGVDRIVVAADGSPTIDELCANGVRGEVYAHEIVTVDPGRVDDYLRAVADEGAELYTRHGLAPVGAFRTAMREDNEAILVWSIASFGVWAEFEQAASTDPHLLGWKHRVRKLGAVTARTVMVDAPLAPLRTGRQPQVEDRRPLDAI